MCRWLHKVLFYNTGAKSEIFDPVKAVKAPHPYASKPVKAMEPKDYFNIIKSTAVTEGMPLQLATLVAAQAAHETGNFTSNVFLQCNNCFGYKYVNGTSLQDGACNKSPEGNDYAHYADIEHSVKEICGWIKRRLNEGRFPTLTTIQTPLQYASLLKNCGYYGDTEANYTAGIANGLKLYA